MLKPTMNEAAWSKFALLPWLKVRCTFLQDIHTEILVEEFRDKIFNTEMVSALGRALSYDLRNSAVEFFTAAVAQGTMLRFFHWIFILKYSQRGFGTRYLILRWSPDLDMHYVLKPTTNEAVRSKFALLP